MCSRVADAELATRAGTGIRRIARLLRETGSLHRALCRNAHDKGLREVVSKAETIKRAKVA